MEPQLGRYSAVGDLESPSDVSFVRVYDRLRCEELALCKTARTRGVGEKQAEDFARLSSLDHPSLTRIRDFGFDDRSVFYSREVGLPSTLSGLISADGIDESWIYLCLAGAAEGLAALHESGLVHGLVLPEHLHVLIADGSFAGVRLADAGLRTLLSPAALKMRERYDSPEVRAGAEITPAADVYQLGTTLLEALRRSAPSVSKRQSRLSHMQWRGVDRNLLGLLNGLVAPDPKKRYANGEALRRTLKTADWALPDRTHDVKSLVTSHLVGREAALGQFAAVLEKAAAGRIHAVEIVGGAGMGRSRMLRECAEQAEMRGWTVILAKPLGDQEPIETIAADVKRALDTNSPAGSGSRRRIDDSDSGAGYGKADETRHLSEGVAEILRSRDKHGAKLLLLVDNADSLDSRMIIALKFLVTDAGEKPVLVMSSGESAIGLTDAEHILLEPLNSRDLKRYIEPLLLSSLNPEETLRAIEDHAAGNPLWVQLLLASWLDSGRLRLVQGRPFYDGRVKSEVPQTVANAISGLVAGLSRGERTLVEAMAVWRDPLPLNVARRMLSGSIEIPGALVHATEKDYRFIGDTIVGPVVLNAMSPERIREWNASFLSALEETELSGSQRAGLLLGAGRLGEGIRALINEGLEAERRSAYHAAYRHLRVALEHHPAGAVAGVDRVRLYLDAARIAAEIGEFRWARGVLEAVDLESDSSAELKLERTLLQANVLRELRHASEAAELYVKAKAIISHDPDLHDRSIELQLEEAANDGARGEGRAALRAVEAIVKNLEGGKPSRLFAIALQRLATLHARLGQTRPAAICELRCERLARRLGDHQLVARACNNLGHLYRLLGRPSRSLAALDRGYVALTRRPQDGLTASILINRAETLIDLRRNDEAETSLLRAKALRERSGERGRLPVVLIDLGHLSRYSGRLAAAAGHLRAAIAVAEEFESPIVHVGRSNLGELFLHMGEDEEAERLLRLSLADQRPNHRGITLINLGRLRRAQGRYGEALQFLGEAETLLRDSAPQYRPHALLDTGRVLLEAGDVDGASFQLAQARAGIERNQEQEAESLLLAGLIASARGGHPQEAFDAALDRVRGLHDPTLQAETLITVLESAIKGDGSEEWIARQLKTLEDAAERTDAKSVAVGVRLIQGVFAQRFARPGAAQGLTGNIQRRLERGGNTIEAALGELMQQLPGAAGAAVFVVGVDTDGKPMVSPVSRANEAPGRVRPYRVAVREFDRKLFRDALAAAAGNVHEAARKLRLPTSTFRYRAIKLGLLKPVPRES